MQQDEEDDRIYAVVVNHEEQYSIWFADREPPRGWRAAGKTGPKAVCLAYINEVWTDMRPLSLRKQMEEWKNQPPPAESPPPRPASPPHPDGKNELVARLEANQPVEAAVRPKRTLAYFKEQIDRGYVFMRFVRTGTELGIRLDRNACELEAADFDAGSGTVRLAGDLVLNYNHVRYQGDIDLATLQGTGCLVFVRAVNPGESVSR